MQHRIRIDKSLITVTADEIVNLVFEIQAPAARPTQRQPLDIVLVLDRSGSMSGSPLASVRAATTHFLRLLGPDDRVGVVTFDNEAEMVLPLAHHDPDIAHRPIDAIREGGSTNMSGGWLKAVEMLTTASREGALRRIIVLTDGQANAGICAPAELGRLVASGQAHGITTSMIGFAEHYDQELLATLADAGHGNDYWCAGPDQTMAVFSAEFTGLASVVAQNLSVDIVPSSAVAAFDVLNDHPTTNLADGGIQVTLGDAYGDEVRRVTVQFNLRPQADLGDVDVAQLTLRWAATEGEVALHTVQIPVVVRRGESNEIDTAADPSVTAEVTTLLAERAREEARRLADLGRFDEASDRMLHGARLMVLTHADVAAEMTLDAQALSDGLWSQWDSKKHFSQRRTTQSGRRRRFDS